jgi:23S rRNA (uracil1939-C5)-methyltransferase
MLFETCLLEGKESRKKMKRGDQIVSTVERLSAKGDGLAYVGGKEVALRQTVPGDRVEAVIGRKRKGRFEARVEKFLEFGAERVPAVCEHFGICGGCRWQDLDYADQLHVKEGMVRSALEGEALFLPSFRPILPSPTPFFYRNKMEFSFGRDREGEMQLGLHVRGRFNRVFNVEKCHLQSEVSNRIVGAVREHAVSAGLSVYDLKEHQGLLRFLVVRESKKTGEVMVNLVVSEFPCESVTLLVDKVQRQIPEITTWVVSLHQGKAQVAIGQEEFILKGKGYIAEDCGGVAYEVSPRSFFQTNSLQAERLYDIIVDLAGDLEGMEVLDLYCGTGGISLHLARRAKAVWGIEVVEEAIADARKNAQRNGVENCKFISGAVEDVLADLDKQCFDLIVVDPPRAGLHKRALAAIEALEANRIIYVSCNPFTLAEDLVALAQGNYSADVVQPVDMFPQTPHCEVVVSLVRHQRAGEI